MLQHHNSHCCCLIYLVFQMSHLLLNLSQKLRLNQRLNLNPRLKLRLSQRVNLKQRLKQNLLLREATPGLHEAMTSTPWTALI